MSSRESVARRDIEVWLFTLWSERGLSDNSLAAYRSDLSGFLAWMRERRGLALDAVGRDDIIGWVGARRGAFSRASIARQLSSLRSYYAFQVQRGELRDNPAIGVRAPPPERRLPRSINEREVESLLDAPDTSTPTGLRDRAMLELMYACGLRVSELLGLDHAMLNLSQGVVRVLGKGGRDRLVPFGEEAESWLRRYLSESGHRASVNAGRWLFPGRNGPMTRQAFWHRVRHYALRAGVRQPVSPHTLRHAFATHLVDRGADLRVVQLLLGHSQLSTTQIYTEVARARLRALHRRHHPRG